MIQLTNHGVYLLDGVKPVDTCDVSPEEARKGTIAYSILTSHNTSGNDRDLKIRFDAMASHDITYVGIIQTARASGLTKFPIPYVLTNCHNSLCAVGGTINEDDHLFGLSAAKKYGGIYVPAHQSVIHSYMRETMTACGRMILGSDSHTRYGALGTMAIGEGGPELVKQLLCRTYDIAMPEVIAVNLVGTPRPGVGPHDVAIALIGAVFANGFVKNKVLEFVGEGVKNLPIEFRNGIDVMTTETTCLSSIWVTDDKTEAYYKTHNRPEDYQELKPAPIAYYDGMVTIDLSKMECMIALPCHPSNAVTINEFRRDPKGLLEKFGLTELLDKVDENGDLHVDQGVMAGCAGGIYDNLVAAGDILRGKSIGNDAFALSAYPASQPVMTRLMRTGVAADLLDAGVTLRTAFCGPCFGAGDVPANGCLSIRHSTRNFPNREGSKPGNGQSAFVALMDARSIAATAANGGILTPATDLDITYSEPDYVYDDAAYKSRVYYSFGKADPSVELRFGPNIADWPEMPALGEDILMKVCSYITDPVTTTDELIPSGETSSYRSNPMKLAEFALSRKDPAYVERAKAAVAIAPFEAVCDTLEKLTGSKALPQIGSVIYARKPGDGSAREQAASCQRVLGGSANIALEYATKRYRSNLINWGMIPFTVENEPDFAVGDYLLVRGVRSAIKDKTATVTAYVIKPDGSAKEMSLTIPTMTDDERQIILDGCLINYYRG
ncbi:MAG: hydratase [Ruminococcaceae bacterium]|nr:hydratase [Oscillospiraceae bacterium]